MDKKLIYPSNAEFAFTILDDTDDTTVANGRPVYDLLCDLGMRTTKTVWAVDTVPENQGPYFAAETLSDPNYLEWVHLLSAEGFEIAFHNATMGSSLRSDTINALDFLKNEFDQDIRLHCNHGQNRENLYWGVERYSSLTLRRALNLFARFRTLPKFEGNNPDSPYYWADVANEQISYIRAFTFRKLNCAKMIPGRPFHDSDKMHKPLFFNTVEASDVAVFNKFINKSSIDKLRNQNGWAIISTHLGKRFYRNNCLDPEFRKSMEYLASLPGWFVPVSQLLDFVGDEVGSHEITKLERTKMEFGHILDIIKGRIFDSTLY